jgi:hypothetical protein
MLSNIVALLERAVEHIHLLLSVQEAEFLITTASAAGFPNV